MRKVFLFLMLLIPTSVAAQTSAFNGYCTQGSVSSLTSGLPSSNKLQGLIPQCTVTVYLTGTVTLATIYSDPSNTPLTNPFTADTKAKWLFYAAENQGYDVVLSGGITPLTYVSPVTLTDLLVGGGGSGGTPAPPLGSLQYNKAGAFGGAPADYGVSEADSFTFNPTGDFNVNSANVNFNQTSALNIDTGSAFNVSATTSVNIDSAVGSQITDHSASAGILLGETGASPIEISSTTGGTSIDTTGGLSLTDISSVGFSIDSASGPGSLAANTLSLYSSAPTGLQGNGSEICTMATGCGGSSGVSQIIAGSGINVSPLGGTGAVTVSATGGGGSGSGGGIIVYSGPYFTPTGTGETLYFPIGGGGASAIPPAALESTVQVPAPASMVIQNFYAVLTSPPGSGNSIVFTWRDNGSSKASTCTISGASATECSDTTHTFTAAQGDLLDVEADVTGTAEPTMTLLMSVGGASGSGVQYNPTTTAYVFASSSTNEDDSRLTSSAVAVSTWSCGGAACTVATTGAHSLAANGWVDVSAMTSWFSVPAGLAAQDTGVGTFQVLATGLTPTQFEFSYATNTGSGSGGNVYSANYWGPYLAGSMPYLNGHGNVTYRFGACSDLDTNFTTNFGSITGTPKYLSVECGLNDLLNNDSVATLEGHMQSIWQKAHAAGFIVVEGTLQTTSLGLSAPTVVPKAEQINFWIPSQAKNFFNTAGGQYYDFYLDLNSYPYLANTSTVVGNSATGGYFYAERVNEAFARQAGSTNSIPWIFSNQQAIDFWMGTTGAGAGFNFLDKNQNTILGLDANNNIANASRIYTSSAYPNHFTSTATGYVDMSDTYAPSLGTGWPGNGGASLSDNFGVASSTNNSIYRAFRYVGSGSVSNYFAFGFAGGTDAYRVYPGNLFALPAIGSSTSPLCTTTNGVITNAGCTGGSSFTAGGDLSGTSSSQTVVGIEGHAIAAPTSAAFVHWNGSGWEYTNPSGSGTVNTGSGYALPAYSSGASDTVGPSNITTDVTGNNLLVPGTIGTGATPPTACGSATGCVAMGDAATTGTPTSGQSYIRADSGTNTLRYSVNGGAEASLSGGAAPPISASWIINTGVAASPASAYMTAKQSGTISKCIFTTTTSDGVTNLVMNVKLAGSSIFSAGSATVTAGSAPQTQTTFSSLTGSPVSVTAGQIWELDITTGTSDWVGEMECQQ
jgi:hypothetical protein